MKKEPGRTDKRKKPLALRFMVSLLKIGIFVFLVLALSYLISAFVTQRIEVHNVSMQDTLMEGDIVLMNKITYRIREPKRYEIICFDSDYEREGLIKRVIGLPGETVLIREGMIFIDGNQIKDVKGLPKIEDPGLAAEEIHLVKDEAHPENNEYFVIGDNREKSIDSRYIEIGNVKEKDILGKAGLRIYPFDRFGFLKK
ncbi:MAG: signal peptidase I [Lachnospiraceae bacterium]|nr:signal peptidase I [Lachnospiraceae bacterium]